MSLITINQDVQFNPVTCSECGISFALPSHFYDSRRNDHAVWHCPNGHQQHFPAKSDTELLRDALAEQKRRAEYMEAERDAARKSLIKAERQTKRIKTRISHGVCPCCNRSFQNLRRHMATKHPDHVTASP